MPVVKRSIPFFCALILALCGSYAVAASPPGNTPPSASAATAVPDPTAPLGPDHPLLQLGPGDQVSMKVFGQPSMDSTMYVADDGSVRVPLAGPVNVAGLSPSEAAERVEAALRSGQFLIDPHVTFSVLQTRSQRVSVIGEVRTPGRFSIESNTTVLDLIAQAGGTTEKAGDIVYILRANATGGVDRTEVNVKSLVGDRSTATALLSLQGGDRLYVPPAQNFYIAGEVRTPNTYRLETGMTVIEAIARAGGVTDRGSTRRVEIKRRDTKGGYTVLSAKGADRVQADDVITVKERIF